MSENTPTTPTENTAEAVKPEVKVETKQEVAAIRKLKLKIDQQEVEMDEPEVIKLAQKGKYADQKLQEAAQLDRRSREIVELLKKDPFKALSHPSLGHDVKQLIAKYIEDAADEGRMTPEQKELRELRAFRKEQEDARKAELDAKHKKELDVAIQAETKRLENDMMEALATSGLPKTEFTVDRIVYYMKTALSNGLENVTVKSVLPLVREDFENAHRSLFAQHSEDTLADLLDDELLAKASKAYMKKVNKTQPAAKTTTTTPVIVKDSAKKDKEKTKFVSPKEWRKQVLGK